VFAKVNFFEEFFSTILAENSPELVKNSSKLAKNAKNLQKT